MSWGSIIAKIAKRITEATLYMTKRSNKKARQRDCVLGKTYEVILRS